MIYNDGFKGVDKVLKKYISSKEQLKEYIDTDVLVNFGNSFTLRKRLNNDKFKLLFFLRLTNYLMHKKKKTPLDRFFQSMSYSLYKYYQKKFCIDINPKTIIGKGIHLPHPIDIVIHGKASIGDFCTILQQVTIGNKNEKNKIEAPTILDNVYLGAGCKIPGSCTVSQYAKIGANSVVLKDIDAYATAVGIPAKIINV